MDVIVFIFSNFNDKLDVSLISFGKYYLYLSRLIDPVIIFNILFVSSQLFALY